MDDDEVQQFSLRWHNHQNSVVGALGHMLNTGALSDVTLSACGASLKAHRLVLAACSQYFAQLFKDIETENNALVIVLGCEVTELRLLLTFMYTGEVTASKRCLPALLRLAHTLQVSGLTDADTNSTLIQSPESNIAPASPIDLDRNDMNSAITNENKIRSHEQHVKGMEYMNENTFKSERDKLSKLDQIVQNLYSTHKLGSLSTVTSPGLSNLEETPDYDRKWRANNSVCTICNKRLSNQYNLRVHMETHAGRRHACRACNHVSRSRDALRKHVAYRHAANQLRDRHV